MAGDEVVKTPTFNATRGLTIAARPEYIFPWILQIGVSPRAGWYSIDLLDISADQALKSFCPLCNIHNPET